MFFFAFYIIFSYNSPPDLKQKEVYILVENADGTIVSFVATAFVLKKMAEDISTAWIRLVDTSMKCSLRKSNRIADVALQI